MGLMPCLELALLLVMAGHAWDGYRDSPRSDERVCDASLPRGVRVHLNAPGRERFDSAKPTRLVLYALPNGNTIEQTIGCRRGVGIDWHFDIQHIGAQTRALRAIDASENTIVAYLEAPGRSWPTWRQQHAREGNVCSAVVQDVLARVPSDRPRITLAGHSGGGSFCFGLIDERDVIPDSIDRIAFLDSHYSYDDTKSRHGDKLLQWLRRGRGHHLVVLTYDDRNVTYKGKRIVSATGGTYRATHRMLARFRRDMAVEQTTRGGLDVYCALDSRARFIIHRNPQNRILHTALVGDMNGFLYAMTAGTLREGRWGRLGGPRAYTRWIQPSPYQQGKPTEPTIPSRPGNAVGGRAFMRSVTALSLADREAAVLRELSSGNLPSFLRQLKAIRVTAVDGVGTTHTAEYSVMPDYLAIGG